MREDRLTWGRRRKDKLPFGSHSLVIRSLPSDFLLPPPPPQRAGVRATMMSRETRIILLLVIDVVFFFTELIVGALWLPLRTHASR